MEAGVAHAERGAPIVHHDMRMIYGDEAECRLPARRRSTK
jgi:hypothetical protein